VYLEEIVATRRENRPPARPDLEERVTTAPAPRSLLQTLGTYRTAVIAECKKASPSKGLLVEEYDPVALARGYEEAGASAISVLTEETYFQGSIEHLTAVRDAVEVPVLRKDFTLDRRDLLEARAAGADLILLIAAILDDAQLEHLLAETGNLGMEAIVEVHDEVELMRALRVAAPIVGINNRNLRTFETDLATTERLVAVIPPGAVIISESGISSIHDMVRLNELRVSAALVGEALVRAPDPSALLRDLVAAGCPDCRRELLPEPAG